MAQAITFSPALGRMPTLQFCRPVELHIDPSYQRDASSEASQLLIKRIAQTWNWDLCQPLVVARRQGLIEQLFVIDGQHRLAAARLRGDIDQLPCVILSYANAADEAKNFVTLNQQRRPLSKLELFKAAVASGDAQAIEIVAAMNEAGLSIAPHSNHVSWKPGMVSNIGGIEAAWRSHGAEASKVAMRALRYAFAGHVLQYAGTVYPGIVAVCDDEIRERGSFGGPRLDAFAQLIGETLQIDWRGHVLAARAADPNLNWGAAARLVVRRAWKADCKTVSAPAQPSAPAAPAPRPANTIRQQRPTVPMRLTTGSVSRNFRPDEEGKAFCDQCDRRVTAGQVGACRDRFCDLRKA